MLPLGPSSIRRIAVQRPGLFAQTSTLGLLLLLSAGDPRIARADLIGISAEINGGSFQIGTLTSTIQNGANKYESGLFQLGNPYLSYMNNGNGQQFRFVQIFTYDSAPGSFPGGTAASVPYLDPLSGGYDYQQVNGGADTSPFYENDDGGGPYSWYRYSDTIGLAEPAFAGQPIHSDASGVVRTYDVPGNFTATITTFITYQDSTLRGLDEFDVLGGFSWADTNGVYSGGAAYGSITQSTLDRLDTALDNSGFADWQAITDYNIPEPSPIALSGAALVTYLAWRRRSL